MTRGCRCGGGREREINEFHSSSGKFDAPRHARNIARTSRTRHAHSLAGFIPLRHFVAILWWDYETQLAAPQCEKYTTAVFLLKNLTLLLSQVPLSLTNHRFDSLNVCVSRSLYRRGIYTRWYLCDVSRFDPSDPNLFQTSKDIFFVKILNRCRSISTNIIQKFS